MRNNKIILVCLYLSIALIIFVEESCMPYPPPPRVKEYLNQISYAPKNLLTVVGQFSTCPNLGGTAVKLNLDSTFNYTNWGDVGADHIINGKFNISKDTLILITMKLLNPGYEEIIRKKYKTKIIDGTEYSKHIDKYYFVKIGNDIYLISDYDMKKYVNEYLLFGNIEKDITTCGLKKI